MGPLVPIAALAMAFDASWAACVTQDGTIRTLGAGTEPRVLRHAVPITAGQPVAVALTENRRIRVVWAAQDGIALFENADGDQPRTEIFPVPAPVRALGFSPSGRIAIAGCADETLISLDAATGEFDRRVPIGLLPAGPLAVASDDGPVVASLSDDSVRRFGLATGVAYVIAAERPVRHLVITADGNTVLALDAAGLLYRWNLSLGTRPQLLELDAASTALAVDGSGDKILIGMPDGRLWLRDLAEGGRSAEFGRPEPAGAAAPVSANEEATGPPTGPQTVRLAGPRAEPPTARLAAPQAGPESGGIIDNDVGFTVYRPRFLAPGIWGDLLVFAHKTDPVVDPDLGPIDPVQVVEAQAQAHFGGRAAPPARVDARSGLPRGSRLWIVPDLPGITCNPSEAPLDWWEPVHKATFRLYAGPAPTGSTVRGTVRIWFGYLLIGEVSLTIAVRAAGAADDQSVAEPVPRYRKIFPSYSHLDEAIVETYEDFARAMGDQYLRDVLELRAGERWEPRIAELIREADVFQLFWSSNSMGSRYCRQEWEHALTLARPSFVRPLYWEDPLPADMAKNLPPKALLELHFVKVRSHRPPEAPADEFVTRHMADQARTNEGPAYAATRLSPTDLTQPVAQQIIADPVLVVQVAGTSHQLRAGSSYQVGRDPQSAIVIADSRVSWAHAILRSEHGEWFIEDHGSRNGTFAGSQRISRYAITEACTLRLVSAADGPALVCSLSRPASLPPSPTIGVSVPDSPPTAALPRPLPAAAPPAAAGPPAAATPYAAPPPYRPAQSAPPAPPAGPAYGSAWTGGNVPARAAKRSPARRSMFITAALVALVVIIGVIIVVVLH